MCVLKLPLWSISMKLQECMWGILAKSILPVCCLVRLKQQLVMEQEDEEEKMRWRVEAEVKLLREELQAEAAAQAASSSSATTSLQVAWLTSQTLWQDQLLAFACMHMMQER